MWKGTVQPRQFRINSRVNLITSSIATALSGATTTRALTSQKIGISKYIGVKRPTSIGLTRPHTAKDMSNGGDGVFFGVTNPLLVRVREYLSHGVCYTCGSWALPAARWGIVFFMLLNAGKTT